MDFNVILDPEFDGQGGNAKLKESVRQMENICSLNDLVDIWRVRNPNIKMLTWRQKTPIMQRRLDFWLIDNALQEDIDQVDIIPSIKSDHSAIVLSFNSVENQTRGPSFWKFNASLLDDKDYVEMVNRKYQIWIEELKDEKDPRLFWNLIKYRTRQETKSHSKSKARERRASLREMEEKLKDIHTLCDQDRSVENINKLDILKTEYDLKYEYIAQGTIARSRARWYELGEKSNKYFFNLESSRGKKSVIRKIFTTDQSLTTKLQVIMKELCSFYSDLYGEDSSSSSSSCPETLTDTFLSKISVPKLSDEQRAKCEEKLTVSECYNALETFQKNKTPSNDGLTVEFI